MRFTKTHQRVAATALGTVFIVILLAIAFVVEEPTPFQYTVFRIVLALAAAGVAATIPGFLEVEIGAGIRAGGAMAVFVIVYFFSPAALVVNQNPEDISNLVLGLQEEVVRPRVTLGFQFAEEVQRGAVISERALAEERSEPFALKRAAGFLEGELRALFFPFEDPTAVFDDIEALTPVGEFLVRSNHWHEPWALLPTGFVEGRGPSQLQSLEQFEVLATEDRLGFHAVLGRATNAVAIYDDVMKIFSENRPAVELRYYGLKRAQVGPERVANYWKKMIQRMRVTYYLDDRERFSVAADLRPAGYRVENEGHSVALEYYYAAKPVLERRFMPDRIGRTGA